MDVFCLSAFLTALGVPHGPLFYRGPGVVDYLVDVLFELYNALAAGTLGSLTFVEPYSVRFTSISTLFSGRPSGIASSSTLVTSATLGDFFDFYVGGVTHLLAWWVLSSKTALCRGLDSVVYLLVFLFELYGNLAAGL